MAQLKIASRSLFSEKVHQAFVQYQKLCKGKEARLKGEKKRALAIRAAHDMGLGYAGGEVDPLIIVAIFILGNKKASEESRADALLQAWQAYDHNFRTLH